MRKYMVSWILVGIALTIPVAAFGDAETIDFKVMMDKAATFKFGDDAPFQHYDPAKADLNKNGVLDAAEFARIAAICADEKSPHHEAVHEAYKKNHTQLAADLGGLAGALLPTLKNIMGAYATLGDGVVTRAPEEKFTGSWGHVGETVQGLQEFGSKWAEGAPDKAKYVLDAMPASAKLTKETAKPEELVPVAPAAAPAPAAE